TIAILATLGRSPQLRYHVQGDRQWRVEGRDPRDPDAGLAVRRDSGGRGRVQRRRGGAEGTGPGLRLPGAAGTSLGASSLGEPPRPARTIAAMRVRCARGHSRPCGQTEYTMQTVTLGGNPVSVKGSLPRKGE